MSGIHKRAGTAYLRLTHEGADAVQLDLRGSWKVDLTAFEREGIAGLDGVHGYKESPRVPSAEGEVTLPKGITLDQLDDFCDGTVTLELANGTVATLRNAWTAGSREIDADEGKVGVRFEGISGEYID